MPDVLALYASGADRLSPEKIDTVGGDIKPTGSRSERGPEYRFVWPDLEVTVSQMPEDQIAHHLKGFEGFVRRAIYKGSVPPRGEEIISRIRSTRLVSSVGIFPEIDLAGRAMGIVSELNAELKPLMFDGGSIYDHDGRLLLGYDGSFEER